MSEKWKNKGLWISIFSLVGLLLGNYGLYDKLGLTAETYQILVDAVLTILIGLGIVSNPSVGTGYKN